MRTTRILAIGALVVGVLALGLTIWRSASPAQASGCQTAAWDVAPAAENLPAGWTVSATQYDLDRKTMSLLAAAPQDSTSSQAVVYATITCFNQGATDSVTRSEAAAKAAGQTVTSRNDLGDQGFAAVDASGAAFVQFRHGDIVTYLAASGAATPAEVDALASAYDKALGGDGGAPAAGSQGAGSPGAGSPGASVDTGGSIDPGASGAAASPAAPDLVAILPTKVGAITLTSDSATGSTLLGDDQGSRAIIAALRAAGKSPDALRVAQASDSTGNSDLSFLVVSVDGMPIAQTEKLVLDTWLSASGAGVTRQPVTLNGKTWTRIDYGDEGTQDYVLSEGNKVVVVTTADQTLAAQAAAALH